MSVGTNGARARQGIGDGDHATPFGKARAGFVIFRQPLREAIEAFGDRLCREIGHRLGAGVDLDAGDRAGGTDDFDQRRAVDGMLKQGFLIEDDTGDVLAHRLVGAQQHFAVIAPGGLGGFEADRIETLLDRGRRLVGGEQPPAVGDHGNCDVFQSFAHVFLPRQR
ncbi:hypothetical protein D9M70_497470 [compost metagenome]